MAEARQPSRPWPSRRQRSLGDLAGCRYGKPDLSRYIKRLLRPLVAWTSGAFVDHGEENDRLRVVLGRRHDFYDRTLVFHANARSSPGRQAPVGVRGAGSDRRALSGVQEVAGRVSVVSPAVGDPPSGALGTGGCGGAQDGDRRSLLFVTSTQTGGSADETWT